MFECLADKNLPPKGGTTNKRHSRTAPKPRIAIPPAPPPRAQRRDQRQVIDDAADLVMERAMEFASTSVAAPG